MSDHIFQSWNAQIAEIINYSGTDDFFDVLIDSLRHHVNIEYPQVWLYEGQKPPTLLYHEFRTEEFGVHVDEYISDKYKIDPFYLASYAHINQGVYTLQTLADQKYHNSQYLNDFYPRLQVSDEIGQIINVTPSKVLNVTLMRSRNSSEFNTVDQTFLTNVEPLIRSLTKQHWTQYASNTRGRSFCDSSAKMDYIIQSAISRFGSSILTSREQQVVDLSLRGHTIKTAAEKLKISADTLKKHRKHIYQKLDITSNSELYAIFIQALPGYVDVPDQDPYALFTSPAL